MVEYDIKIQNVFICCTAVKLFEDHGIKMDFLSLSIFTVEFRN